MPPENNGLEPGKPNQDNTNLPPISEQEKQPPSLGNILDKIHQGIESKKIQGDLPLTIWDGNKVVFQAVPGKEPTRNNITSERIDLIQKAIQDPQGLSGSVRMYVGNEKVFHIRNGEVVTDTLGLTPQQARSQESLQQTTKAEPTQSQPAQTSTPSLQDQINALQATVERQQHQIDALNQKLNQFINSPVFVANQRLNNWFGNLRDKFQTAGQEAVAQVSNKLEQNKATLVAKAQEFLAGVKENVTDTLHAARNNVQAQAGEVALGAINAATAKLVSAIGEKLPDGSFVIESRVSNQRLEVSGNNVALKERPQLDAQALWNKYSQDAPQERPIQRTLVVAQNAIRDGMTRTAVEDMLKADPQFQKVQLEQGLNKAQEYAQQMTRSASRREQPVREPQQQQRSRSQSQNNGLQQ